MERNMAWAQPQHRRGHSLGSVALRDKDEDLALFKDMGKRDKSPFSRTEDQLVDHTSLLTKFGGLSHPQSAPPAERRGIGAELLNSDADKTDYDWLMTPPGTPLFPSMDADAPALQHGSLINRSLAAIKTSRQASTAPRARSPAPSLTRGNPSPSRRPSTPQKPQTPSKHPTSTSTRPATPTRSSTPSSHTSPQQPRTSTPTRQPSRPVTPLGARPATPTRRSPTPASTSRPSTPTLRRSTSSPTGSRNGGSSHIRNPSPTRSTASSATSVTTTRPARGLSPARGPSPARGLSPSPSSRGRSPSPSLRAPYPVDASDDIPPNLRTTSDRPSSAQRRAIAYGASPGEGLMRRTPSPARSVTSSVTRVERVSCRGETSDSESSFDTGSQSGVSAYGGLVTPERRRMLVGHGTGGEYGRASSVKGKRSGSATSSPQLGASASKKSFESAAREYHRGQVAAFRPLMTNSSISTFYSSRASGLLRRPLTPSSTCSSSEHGATVAHDSDEDAGSQWKPATKTSSGAHSPLHLFNKSIREAGTLDASISIVDDNDELSSFFRTPEALQVECMSIPVVSHCKVQELESPEFASELNWLNSRNAHELDREYLKDFDGAAAPTSKQDSKHGSPGLEKIRDKLRHLKRESNEDTESASRAQETNIGDHEVELLLHGASCEVCGHRRRNCQCTTTTTSSTSQAQEAPSSPRNVESSRTDPKAANAAYAKEKDIWYIYRHSSEYEVPVAGFSETKMEIDPPQILAKEVHMRPSPSFSTSPPTVYIGKNEHGSRNVHKENVKTENVPTRLISETGNVTLSAALGGTEEFDGGLAATDIESKGREFGATTTISSMPKLLTLKEVLSEPERVTNIQGKQNVKESAQVCSSSDSVSSEPPQKSPMPTLQYSSPVTHRANTVAQSLVQGSVKKVGQENSEGGEQLEWGDRTFDIDAEVSPVHSNSNLAEERRPEVSSSRSTQEEAREQGPASGCTTVEAHCIEDNVSVIPQVKKIIWQEEDLQQLLTQTEVGRVLSRADEKERTCREGDEVELEWENGKVEDPYFVAGYHPNGSVEIQRQVAHTQGPNGVKPKTTHSDDSGSYCFEPLELAGQKYLLTGEVHIDSALYGATRFSDDSLVIKVQSSDGRVVAVDNPARLISEPQNEMNSFAVYEYSHWAEVGAHLTLSAHSGRGEESSSSEILFYPREHHVHVTTDEKQPRIPKFHGRPGVYAKAIVVPALDVAKITAVSEKDGVTGGLKSGELIAVTCSDGVNVAGPLYDDFTSAGIHSSRKRNPESLLKAPDAKAAQSRPDVPTAKTDVQEVQRGNVTSHNGDLPQEVVDTYNVKASTDELTGEHFDYILDSKRDPRRAQPALPEVLVPSAGIPNSAIVKPSSFNGVNQSTNGSERLIKEKTPPRNQSRDNTPKFTSRADAELPAGVSQSRDSTPKFSSRADAELPVLVSQSRDSIPKCTSGADAELPVGGVNQNRDTNTKCTSRGDSGLPVGVSQSRITTPKSTSHVEFVPKAKVSVEAPVKEEIVENADSPSPGTTRKHMSSFKFSHKKTGPSELKRSNTSFSSSTTKVGTQPAIPSSKRTMNNSSSSDSSNNKVPVTRKPASPQLNKGRSVRAPSPARPPANAKAAATHVAALPAAGANGEGSPEEPSIHSRFSNITVRSGSDTEIFDWGPSSLEETSSRCGSSSGPNAASVAVLSRSPSSSLPLEDMAYGHHIDDEDEDDEVQTTTPSPQSSMVNSRDDGIQSSPSSESTAGSSAMHNHMHPTERVRPHHDPTSTVHNNNYNGSNYNNNSNNNYAPKQNLDKLSEKLEQLETFGARVLLRNPQQQFLRSPPSHGNHSNSKPALVGNHLQSYPLVSCRSSRSLGSVQFGGPKSASPVPDKCRCSIL